MKRYLPFVLVAVLAAFVGYQLQQYSRVPDINEQANNVPAKKKESMVGHKADNFALMDTDGNERQLSEWQGKVIAINFWATWCPPCREEIPAFVELQQAYSEKGLQFVGIALQTTDEIRDFLVEFNVNYPSLVGGQEVMAIAEQLGNGIGALPYTVIFDRDGIIQFTKRGTLSKTEAEDIITRLL